MTIPVVQFCFAIANGDPDSVRSLFPKISIKEDIITLLSTLVNHIDSEQPLTLAACKVALECILDNPDLGQYPRSVAQRLLNNFLPNLGMINPEKSVPNVVAAAVQEHKLYLPSGSATFKTNRALERSLESHSEKIRKDLFEKKIAPGA